MPQSDDDTIRILVSTDNHVGYEERDPIRRDDSWKTFDEVMQIAKAEDVDMVLLAGDLFHDNKPSHKSLHQVMRSLRKHCLGLKPVELEFLSDPALVFEGAFPHVNYEDPDINISIPVFSIHGNHDDPSGDVHLCPLDLLQDAGLVNYYGRISEGDNIEARPILLRKGSTNLALYGLSNVRDERMFRTFRDGKVKWFKPSASAGEWFNILAVHQNHHAHTATSYLPESVLPDFLDLVVWGHEHECIIDPSENPETGFHVMQPGSSVATSLVPGEAVRKHVAVVSVSGKSFQVDKIPLKTVRPFVTREIILAQDKRFKGLDTKKDNRQEVTKRLMDIVNEMIEEANEEWVSRRDEEEDEMAREQGLLSDPPLPLIRLKVEYTASEGGQFDCENPQRFSQRFIGKVANTNDIVYFYRKKSGQSRKTSNTVVPEDAVQPGDKIEVERLVASFLAAQSLKILPQAPFGDAVAQFVTKDDKMAMAQFVEDSLAGQVKQMLSLDPGEEDELEDAMEKYKARLEAQFAAGNYAYARKTMVKPRPEGWDSDMEGHWDDQPGVWAVEKAPPKPLPSAAATTGRGRRRNATADDDEEMPDVDSDAESQGRPKKAPAKRGGKAAATATRAAPKKAAPKKAAPPKPAARGGRGRKAATPFVDSEDSEEDVVMDSDPPAPESPPTRVQPRRTARATKQTTLNFSQSQARGTQQSNALEISDDEISDDPFESAPAPSRARRR